MENSYLNEKITYINDIDIRGKRVFIRADFNVPLDNEGNIVEDTRIRAVLPTIDYALDENAKIILASHMGRPKGKYVKELSLKPVARRLKRLLKKEIIFVGDCIGPEVESVVSKMDEGDIVLLENLRFHIEEEKNEEGFSKKLASLCDVYINDAFAVAHRAHASVVGITEFTDVCAAGFLMKKELTYFSQAMDNPARPLVAIIGGAKVSSKLRALINLVKKVDKMIIGGGMAFTFLKAMGYNVGKSIVEDNLIDMAKEVMEEARKKGVKLYLPVDCVVADKFSEDANVMMVPVQEIPEDWIGMDIGMATTVLFRQVLQNAKTIIWNGPMGVFEMDAFSRGTYSMVEAVANSYALTIVGGGDTDVAVNKLGGLYKMSYVSTGGGAFIELLEGKTLPAIKALIKCREKNRKE